VDFKPKEDSKECINQANSTTILHQYWRGGDTIWRRLQWRSVWRRRQCWLLLLLRFRTHGCRTYHQSVSMQRRRRSCASSVSPKMAFTGNAPNCSSLWLNRDMRTIFKVSKLRRELVRKKTERIHHAALFAKPHTDWREGKVSRGPLGVKFLHHIGCVSVLWLLQFRPSLCQPGLCVTFSLPLPTRSSSWGLLALAHMSSSSKYHWLMYI